MWALVNHVRPQSLGAPAVSVQPPYNLSGILLPGRQAGVATAATMVRLRSPVAFPRGRGSICRNARQAPGMTGRGLAW